MVVGSGYIAVELAGILNALGSDVTVVVRYHKALRSFDSMLSDSLMEEMESAGIKFAKFSVVGIIMLCYILELANVYFCCCCFVFVCFLQ